MIWLVSGASLLALAGLTHWRAGRAERAAEARYPPEGEFVAVNGRRVHAVVRGKGPGLVLIHGLSGNARDFTFALIEKLAPRFRVIAFDRPGLGWSDALPRGSETLAAQAAHLAAAARELGAERPILVGQSYGGAVALAWALAEPERVAGLVNVSCPSHPWAGLPPLLYMIAGSRLGGALAVPLITAFVPEKVVERAVEAVFQPQEAPPGYSHHIGAGLTLRRASFRANARHRLALKPEIRAMAPRYPGLALPIEIVHGEADTTVSITIHAEAFVREVPQARLTRLPGIGHAPHHSAEAEVVAAIGRAAERAGLG